MENLAPTPSQYLFQFQTCKFQPPHIGEIDVAIGPRPGHQAWNCVDDAAERIFDRSRPSGIFGLGIGPHGVWRLQWGSPLITLIKCTRGVKEKSLGKIRCGFPDVAMKAVGITGIAGMTEW